MKYNLMFTLRHFFIFYLARCLTAARKGFLGQKQIDFELKSICFCPKSPSLSRHRRERKKVYRNENLMRYLLYIWVFLSCVSKIYSQETISSKIIDENGNGIPFATIGIIEKNFGIVTFEDGSFNLVHKQEYVGDTLVISSLGFKQEKISYDDFLSKKPESILLKETATLLNEIVVLPEKLFFYEMGFKRKKSPNHLGISSPLKGATVAILIENISEPVLIDEIAIVIRKLNMDSVQLRCRIFDVNRETGLPGSDLIDENLIKVSTQKEQELVFKPKKDIWIDHAFFVGFEWVMTKEQFAELQQAKEAFNTDFIDEIIAQHLGYKANVNENKRVQFRDEQGKLIKKVNLTNEQTDILNEKDAASPKLQFKIKMKGTRTYTGSPITGKWSKNSHEALVSVRVGSNTKKQKSDSKKKNKISFGDREIVVAELEDFLTEGMEEESIQGLSMVIFDQNKILYHHLQGNADVENGIPVNKNTIFEAASLSKPLFAYFIMKYVDAGILDLDRPLFEYLPYEDIEHDERYKTITARMVLSHTTGFPNWRDDYDGQLFISFEPGTDYQYSGEGFQYLAKVLAHLLETNDIGLEQVFQEKVAQPLGLKTTKFLQDEKNFSNKAAPYKNGVRVENRYSNDVFGAAFSVHSEAKDFSIWLRALLNNKGLTEDSFTELFKDQFQMEEQGEDSEGASAWTLGFGKYQLGDAVLYGHGGNNYGYTSGFFIDREQKMGAVLFTNADQVSD
ncbi:MAG: serine hydrolase, partial [Bacteroidota bacterium]